MEMERFVLVLVIVFVFSAIQVARLNASALASGARQGSGALAIDALGDFLLPSPQLHRDVACAVTESASLRARSSARETRLVVPSSLRRLQLRLVEDGYADTQCKPRHSHTNCQQTILIQLECSHHKFLSSGCCSLQSCSSGAAYCDSQMRSSGSQKLGTELWGRIRSSVDASRKRALNKGATGTEGCGGG
jgi:hypothetical protein